MAKRERDVDEVVRRIKNFFDVYHRASITGVTLQFHITAGKDNGVWHNDNNGRVYVPLTDVRLATIAHDKEPDEGEQREIDVLLYKFMMED